MGLQSKQLQVMTCLTLIAVHCLAVETTNVSLLQKPKLIQFSCDGNIAC